MTKGPHKAFDRKYLKDGRTKNFNKLLYTVICNEEGRIRSFTVICNEEGRITSFTVIYNEEGRIRSFKSKLLFALESFVFL